MAISLLSLALSSEYHLTEVLIVDLVAFSHIMLFFSLRMYSGLASKYGNRLLAVCQMTSTCDKECNLRTVDQLIEKTASFGAKVIVIVTLLLIITILQFDPKWYLDSYKICISSCEYTFFYKKTFIRKLGSIGQNLKAIL